MALCQIESTIHPRCPTLYFPNEIGEKLSNPKSSALSALDVPVSKEQDVSGSSTNNLVEPVLAPSESGPVHEQLESVHEETVPESAPVKAPEGNKMSSETERVVKESTAVPEIAEPRAKRSKLAPVKEVNSGKVEAMLSDFVDTWLH